MDRPDKETGGATVLGTRLVAAIALVLAVSGCAHTPDSTASLSEPTTPLPSDYRPVPTPPMLSAPRAAAPTTSNRYDSNNSLMTVAQPLTVLESQMTARLRAQTDAALSLKADCVNALVIDETTKTSTKSFTCNAVVTGTQTPVAVPFNVMFSVTGTLFVVEATPTVGLLLGDKVRSAWAEANLGVTTQPLSCDTVLPAVALIPLDETTRYRCAVGGDVRWVKVTAGGYEFSSEPP